MISKMTADCCAEIPELDFHLLPSGGGNSPNWILGHLVVVNRFGLSMLGLPTEELGALMPIYGPGSQPTENTASLMTRDELLDQFVGTGKQFLSAIEAASVEQLDAAQTTPFFQDALPTTRELLAHLLTTHLGLHFGQLSAWRRSRGYDSVLKIG